MRQSTPIERRRWLCALFTALLLAIPQLAPRAVAQEGDDIEVTPDGRRTVSVIGDATTRLSPDHVVFSVVIETSGTEVDSARRENDARLEELNQLYAKLAIAPGDIHQDYLVIQADYLEESETPRFSERPSQSDRRKKLIGYTTWRRMVVTLRKLDKVEAFVSGTLKLGVNYVSSGEFRVADMTAQQNLVRLRAIDDARKRADEISAQLGMKVKRAIDVSGGYVWNENWWSQSSSGSSRARMMRAAQQEGGDLGSSDGETPTMLPGEILVKSRVRIIFEIE